MCALALPSACGGGRRQRSFGLGVLLPPFSPTSQRVCATIFATFALCSCFFFLLFAILRFCCAIFAMAGNAWRRRTRLGFCCLFGSYDVVVVVPATSFSLLPLLFPPLPALPACLSALSLLLCLPSALCCAFSAFSFNFRQFSHVSLRRFCPVRLRLFLLLAALPLFRHNYYIYS